LAKIRGDALTDIFDAPDIVQNGDVKLAIYRDGPDVAETSKPPVIFMHGFPELARSFRHQMQTMAAAGYPVFAPDMRGYNRSDKPTGKENYGFSSLSSDMEAILDHYQIKKAVFVGHDWGAILLWALPFYMPQRMLGAVGLSYPMMGRLPINPLWGLRILFHRKMYMLQFQKEGRCEKVFEADIARAMRFFMQRIDPEKTDQVDMSFKGKSLNIMDMMAGPEEDWFGLPLLDDGELEIYIDAFRKGGFTAPMHWYRNMKENWKDMKRFLVGGKMPYVDLPSLILTSEFDFATPPRLANGMHKRVGPVKRVDMKGCSHWLQMEKPEEVSAEILTWLEETDWNARYSDTD
jgi:pimeloyl-ACP methyl ester carboxylesterase